MGLESGGLLITLGVQGKIFPMTAEQELEENELYIVLGREFQAEERHHLLGGKWDMVKTLAFILREVILIDVLTTVLWGHGQPKGE